MTLKIALINVFAYRYRKFLVPLIFTISKRSKLVEPFPDFRFSILTAKVLLLFS